MVHKSSNLSLPNFVNHPCNRTPVAVAARLTVQLLQLRVFCFRFLQDGDVWVGIFPEGEEIFVGGQRPDAGGIGIRSSQ